MAEALVNDAPVALAAAITSTQTTVTRASATTGWPGDSNGPASANFRLNVSDGTNQELMLVTGGQGTTTLTVTRAVEPIGTAGSPATAYAFGTNATMTPTVTAAGFFAAQPASYDETVLTKLSLAPVAYWKLNDPVGSSTAADSSGNGYTLTVYGTVTFGEPSVVPSDSETSAQGDGTTGYLSGGPFALVPTGASPCTVIAACKAPSSSSGAAETIVMLGTDSAVGDDIRLFYNFSNPQYSSITNTTAVYAGLTDGNTHLIGCSYSVAGMQVWFDGTLVGTALFTPNLTSAPVYLLSNNASQMYGSAPTGRVAIFAGVLTPKDWALLTQAFTGV